MKRKLFSSLTLVLAALMIFACQKSEKQEKTESKAAPAATENKAPAAPAKKKVELVYVSVLESPHQPGQGVFEENSVMRSRSFRSAPPHWAGRSQRATWHGLSHAWLPTTMVTT